MISYPPFLVVRDSLFWSSETAFVGRLTNKLSIQAIYEQRCKSQCHLNYQSRAPIARIIPREKKIFRCVQCTQYPESTLLCSSAENFHLIEQCYQLSD